MRLGGGHIGIFLLRSGHIVGQDGMVFGGQVGIGSFRGHGVGRCTLHGIIPGGQLTHCTALETCASTHRSIIKFSKK